MLHWCHFCVSFSLLIVSKLMLWKLLMTVMGESCCMPEHDARCQEAFAFSTVKKANARWASCDVTSRRERMERRERVKQKESDPCSPDTQRRRHFLANPTWNSFWPDVASNFGLRTQTPSCQIQLYKVSAKIHCFEYLTERFTWTYRVPTKKIAVDEKRCIGNSVVDRHVLISLP